MDVDTLRKLVGEHAIALVGRYNITRAMFVEKGTLAEGAYGVLDTKTGVNIANCTSLEEAEAALAEIIGLELAQRWGINADPDEAEAEAAAALEDPGTIIDGPQGQAEYGMALYDPKDGGPIQLVESDQPWPSLDS